MGVCFKKILEKFLGKLDYLLLNNFIMGQLLNLSENERKNILKMHSMLNEQSTSQIQSMVNKLSSEFSNLSQQFDSNANNLKGSKKTEVGEQSSISSDCDSVKMGVNLYVAMIATTLKNAVEYNIPIVAASTITERMELVTKQMNEMLKVMEYLKKIQEYVKP